MRSVRHLSCGQLCSTARTLQPAEFFWVASQPRVLALTARCRVRRVCAPRAASQLPPHLQLDVYLQLYRGMVQQVNIFKACPDDFHRAVVMKLQNSICTA
jgi:hypothetical protein